MKPVGNSTANARSSGGLKIPRYGGGGGQKAADGGKGGKPAERPISMLHPSSPTGALFKHLHFVPFQIFICDGLYIILAGYHRMSGLIPDFRFHISDKKTTVVPF